MEQKYVKHFVFVLTHFSFEDMEGCDEDEFDLCRDILNRLSSMSFPLLGILEGGYTGLCKLP